MDYMIWEEMFGSGAKIITMNHFIPMGQKILSIKLQDQRLRELGEEVPGIIIQQHY